MSSRDRDEPEYRSARETADKHKSGYESKSFKVPEGMKVFKLKTDGKKTLEIIPFRVGKGNPYAEKGTVHYERTYFTHGRIGTDEDTYTCPSKTNDEPCPVCEARAKLAKSDDADEKALKALKPSERQLFLVIDHADREAGIQFWDVSYHLFGRALNIALKELDEGDPQERFYHPRKGFSVRCMVEEKPNPFGKKPFYSVERVSFKEREEQLDIDVDKMECLDDCVVVPGYDELKDILNGKSKKADDDEKPSKKRDDDDDDRPKKKREDEDDDKPRRRDDDDEKPKRRDDDDDRPKKKAEDDDDRPAKKRDDDDDDRPKKKRDEEDDEKPRRRDDDDEKPKKKVDADDENWDDPPKKKKTDDDDEKPSKKRDDDDDDRPKKKREDEDDDKPAKKKSLADDDDWDAPPKKKNRDED